jgi:RHS repeat-associated protein
MGTNITRQYDARGVLSLYQDEDNKETSYDTDDLGRVNHIKYPDDSTEDIVYEDVTGLVAARKDRKGQWTSYFYDSNGRLSEVRLGGPRATDPKASPTGDPYLRYRYDLGGRLIEEASRDGATQYDQFDLLGRPGITHTIRYSNHSGLEQQPVILDVHTQQHVWSLFNGERDRWRMPAAGNATAAGNPSSGWRSWIIEEHDAAGNLKRISGANDIQGSSTGTIVAANGRGLGRLMTRTRFYGNAGNALEQNYGYADGQVAGAAGLPAAAPGPASGLLGRSQIAFGSYTVAGGQIERDAARRPTIETSLGTADRQTDWGYDDRGRLKAWSLAHQLTNSVAFTSDTLIHADFRQARSVTTDPQDLQELGSLASKYELPSWTASKSPLHYYLERALSNESTPRTYAFDQGGRRTSDGRWTSEFDEGGRLSAIHRNDQRIEYTYNAQGRMIGRRALHETSPGQFIPEDRSTILDADHLPADTTWVWDPVTDQLVAIFEAGKSTGAAPIDPESGLLRQFVHGDQGYDDPVEVTGRENGAPVRYLPMIDEAGGGSVEAVVGPNGLLAERVLYGDAYGDAPRYLNGAVVDKIEVEPSKRGDGSIEKVTVRVHLSETVDQTTLQTGLRLAAINAGNQVLVTATPQIDAKGGQITAVLDATEWTTLTSANGATHLEIAVTDKLRAALWTGPVMPLAEWLRDGTGRATSAQFPVIQRESFASLNALIANIPPGSSKSETLLAIHNLYLVASNESKTNLFIGFKAGVTDPRTGFVYFRARWYDPQDGTWLTDDAAGYHDSSNLYAFGMADPVGHSDPTGNLSGRAAWAFTKAAGRQVVVGGAIVAGGAIAIGTGAVTAPVALTVGAVVGVGAVAYNAYHEYHVGHAQTVGEAVGLGIGNVLGLTSGFEAYNGMDLSGNLLNEEERAARWGDVTGNTAVLIGGLFGAEPLTQATASVTDVLRNGVIDSAALDSAITEGFNVDFSPSFPPRVTPETFGLSTIAENQEWLDMFNESLRNVAGGDNAYSAYLASPDTASIQELNAAWKAVSSDFLTRMRAAGFDISETHHWNWTRQMYRDYVFDPRHLVPIPREVSYLHRAIHYALTSSPNPEAHFINKFIAPIRQTQAIHLGPARSVLRVGD